MTGNELITITIEDEAYDWLKTQSFPKRKRSKTMMCFMDVNQAFGCQTLEFPLKKKT